MEAWRMAASFALNSGSPRFWEFRALIQQISEIRGSKVVPLEILEEVQVYLYEFEQSSNYAISGLTLTALKEI